MKNKTKDNKGITLIALIITIILMLILIAVSVSTGINTYNNSKVSKFIAEMELLQTKIDDLVATMSTEELNNLRLDSVTTQKQKDAISSAFNNGEITVNDIKKYKVFTTNNILEILNIEDVEDDIMVNFETREIVSVSGVKSNGTTYYTQYIINEQKLIDGAEITRDIDFTVNLSLDGINAKVTINNIKIVNGTLSYKEKNDNYWNTVTNYTQKDNEYIVNIEKSGTYTFRIQDNNSLENKKEKELSIKLTNKPKTNLNLQPYNYGEKSEKWAYVKKDSKNYVWIPRFVYNSKGDIKFIKGTSNVATDDTYIDESNWTLHDKFTTLDGKKLTGVWVNVNSLNQSGLDMKNLLNDNTKTFLSEIN